MYYSKYAPARTHARAHTNTHTHTEQTKSVISSRFSPSTMLTFLLLSKKTKNKLMFCTHWGWIWAHETLQLLLCDITYLGAPCHSLCRDVLHFSLHRMPHHINFPALTSDYVPVCKPVKCVITVVVYNFLNCKDLFLYSNNFTEPNTILTALSVSDDWGNT
jgi:hypothetical protein